MKKKRTMNKLLIVILTVVLLVGCIMDYVDTITVKNQSTFKLDVLINEDYPDTTLIKTRLIKTAISPTEKGPLDLVNKKWEEHLKTKGKVTLYFVESKPIEFYDLGRQGQQQIYGKLILTKGKLDSLGGLITFPDDVTITESP